MEANYLKIIRVKDVSAMCDIGQTTAKKILQDIKKEYGIKKVTLSHLHTYFGYSGRN